MFHTLSSTCWCVVFRLVIVMEEVRVFNFITDVGVNRQVNDEDIEAFHGYLDVRLGGSDDSSED